MNTGQTCSVTRYGRERTKDDAIPPFGDLFILGHQSCMNVGLLTHRTPALGPDLFAEIEERVRQRCGDGGKRQPVRHRKGRPTLLLASALQINVPQRTEGKVGCIPRTRSG